MSSFSREHATPINPSIEQIPWCAALLADPSFSLLTTSSPAPHSGTGDTFFGSTLATASTVLAYASQQRDPVFDANTDLSHLSSPAIQEVRTFYMIGDGVNGHPAVAHGGFIAAILDESMGNLLGAIKDFEQKKSQYTGVPYRRVSTMTAYLNLRFRKPLPTPTTVVVRTWIDRVEGRKHFISGSVENGNGDMYTEADALFISVRDAL